MCSPDKWKYDEKGIGCWSLGKTKPVPKT